MLLSTTSIQAIAGNTVTQYSNIPGVDCVINPYKVVDIASPVAGVIETLHAERSQQVNAGQVVVQLDADVERASVVLARFRADIQSEIKLGQVNMKFDQRRSKRIHSLKKSQAVSMANIDEVEREAGLSKWKLQQARELASVRKLELKRAEEQLQQKSIKAPFDGFVLDTFKHRGEYVDEQSIFRLAQLNPLVIEAIVPMENFGKIKVGMEAEILPESFSEEKLVGKVSIVDRIGDTASNTFGVRLVMPNPENRIPAGIKCVVKFFQQSDENVAVSELSQGVMVEKMMVEAILGKTEPEKNLQIDIDDIDNHIEIMPPEKKLDDANVFIKREEVLVQQIEQSIVEDNKVSSYVVVTEQAETLPLTRTLISQLRDSGVSDLQKVDRGPYKGLILLGIYKKRSRAEKRQNLLADLGFSSFIKGRY